MADANLSSFNTQLCASVLENLRDQHNWGGLQTQILGSVDSCRPSRSFISGLPPQRIYVHPDEQVEALEIERRTGRRPSQDPEFEWVVPLHIDETLSLRILAAIFNSIGTHPRNIVPNPRATLGRDWRGAERTKRILLAVVHDDSTIVYYLVHDGIVKPRQN